MNGKIESNMESKMQLITKNSIVTNYDSEVRSHIKKTAINIYKQLLGIGNIPDVNEYGWSELILKSLTHLNKIEAYVSEDKPITMVLPAFPAKSPNRNKTLGQSPDYAEVIALKRLNRLCEEISNIYSAGANIIICSDGRVFSNIVGVRDEDVTLYGQTIQDIIEYNNLDNLSVFNLDSHYCPQSYDKLRQNVLEEFGEPTEIIKYKIKTDPEELNLFNGIHRFLFEDGLYRFPNLSRNQVRKITKDDTYELARFSAAWGRVVEEHFPDAVRLSIHPQKLGSKKFGVQMVPALNNWMTPWHSVAVFDGNTFQLTKRKIAESMGAKVKTISGKYAYLSLVK